MKTIKLKKPSDLILKMIIRDVNGHNINLEALDSVEYQFYVNRYNTGETFYAKWSKDGDNVNITEDGKILIPSESTALFSEGVLCADIHVAFNNELFDDEMQDIYKVQQTTIFIKD